MLDFRIETFLTLCKIKNYTKTANALSITQPAVSQHIKVLEEMYGGKLFHYDEKKLKLTERGKYLYEFATTVNADNAHLKKQLATVNLQAENISFGATLSIGEYVMPRIIAALLRDYPDLKLHMQVNNTQLLLKKLNDGEINFALLEGFFDKSEYRWELFSKEEFIAVCSPCSPLAEKNVQLNDILSHRIFIRESGSGTRDIFEQILYEHNYTLNSFRKICVVGNMNAVKELVYHNLGITFLYKVAAAQEIASGKLKQITIQDFTVERSFHFVYLKNSLHEKEYFEWFQNFSALRYPLNISTINSLRSSVNLP